MEEIKAPHKKERTNRHSRWGNGEQQQQQQLPEEVKAASSYGEWRASKAARLREEAETVEHTRKPHRHHRAQPHSQDRNNVNWRNGSIPQGSLKETSSRDRNTANWGDGSIPQRSFTEPSHKSYKRESSRISHSRTDNHGSQSSRFTAPGRETAISSSSATASAVHNSRFKKVNKQSSL